MLLERDNMPLDNFTAIQKLRQGDHMLMESTGRSPSMVENYLRFKPNYPRKLIDFLYDDCGFSWESVIADIGSGTGTFTRLLLEKGSRVVGIEPNREMRETAERILCDEFPRFVSLDATAENTTLSDVSIHHIVCAQSFHFFNIDKCKKEFARILRPGGSVALIRSRPVVDNDEFSHEYEALVRRYSNDEGNNRTKINENLFSDFFPASSFLVFSLPDQLILDFEALKGRMLFFSDMPALGEKGYHELIEELEILFELYNQSGKVVLKYKTEAYAGKLGLVG